MLYAKFRCNLFTVSGEDFFFCKSFTIYGHGGRLVAVLSCDLDNRDLD